MPAPVTFNLTLAPLPVNFNGTPQQWAQAVVDRLTISPSAPWSSFQNGGTIPTSNVGPILYNGVQWMVWNSGTASYENLIVDGGGIIGGTVQNSALAPQVPGGIQVYDGSGNAAILSPDTDGEVVTQVGGLPVWAPFPQPPGSNFFLIYNSAPQVIPTQTSSPSQVKLQFDTVQFSFGVGLDLANFQVVIPANEVWYFYFATQLVYSGSGGPTVQIPTGLSVNGSAAIRGVSSMCQFETDDVRVGFVGSGIAAAQVSNWNASIVCTALESVATSNLTFEATTANSYFGGFRIL